MSEQVMIAKQKNVCEMQPCCYPQSPVTDETIIPASWELSEPQRNFIESMVENKNQ
ncbi:hypothetical protein [[Pantoea] beijingensis]|uniref:hypothetical protein n=1 Tax=[Pantoea] beijingensis TaxID=1324864 RepID=UPI0012B00E4B|nr:MULTISPECIES: hypothetical protein [Erwiniaceae]